MELIDRLPWYTWACQSQTIVEEISFFPDATYLIPCTKKK